MRRIVLPLFAVAAFLAALRPYVARADEEGQTGPDRVTLLEAHVHSLRADVAYLLSREETMTAAASTQAAGLSTAANHLTRGTLEARANGFEAAAISAPSRVLLLKGLEDAGGAMGGRVPALTPGEVRLRREADELRRNLPK